MASIRFTYRIHNCDVTNALDLRIFLLEQKYSIKNIKLKIIKQKIILEIVDSRKRNKRAAKLPLVSSYKADIGRLSSAMGH